nr:MAG TPA: YopX protein [Caudoviricetes sp.]
MIPKFRAWKKAGKELGRVGQITFELDGSVSCVLFKGKFLDFNVPINEIVLMQSTGLKDKNGKEIFEGDVVRQVRTQPTTENETITGVVTMIEGTWLIMNDCEQLASKLWSETDENEIIGNIYENPELLEDKE